MTTFYVHITIAEIKEGWYDFIVQKKLADIRKSPDKTEAIIKLPRWVKTKTDVPERHRDDFYKFWTDGKILNHSQAKALSKSWNPEPEI